MQETPRVSVVMANYNAAPYVAAAITSVLRQTETSLELIFSDDGSSDESVNAALAAAAGDPRFVLVKGGPRSGPGAARNRALDKARGRWIAIVDSDDYLHPERLERLIGQAETDGADIAADDMLVFHEGGGPAPHAHLSGPLTRAPGWISTADYASANVLYGSKPALGYLKPILRRERFTSLRYDESLRIAEDFDLVMRLLLSGARMRVYPELSYFYRKHAASISHRMTGAHVAAMIAAQDKLEAPSDEAARLAFRQRRASLQTAQAFDNIIEALKARRFGAALGAACKRPQALALLRYPILGRLARLKPYAKRENSTAPRIALLSRQRVVGATNGSSAYLLSIANALKGAGFEVDFIGASPKLFGRWPFLKLKPDTDVFASYRVHGAWRIGRYVIASDPRRALAALTAIAGRALSKLKLPIAGWSKPAEYSIAAQATRADMLFIARAAASNTKAVLCDYGFLAPLAPYALAPGAPTLVVMHDLFSARVRDGADQVTLLTPEQEYRLLGQADIVIAIQETEAATVRDALPRTSVITAPHAVDTVKAAQPGQNDLLLFVGSNTAPNISGLGWFFADVWPKVRAARPHATLNVAGSVARSLNAIPDGVRVLGVVPDLSPLYSDAGVVISPLLTGSGLKIKLIEAMAQGKAIVGTTITLQGVEDIAAGAAVVSDDPAEFAQAILDLTRSETAREHLAQKALACAEQHFSPSACYGALLAGLKRR